MTDLSVACPRCGSVNVQRFAGPCANCRSDLSAISAPSPDVHFKPGMTMQGAHMVTHTDCGEWCEEWHQAHPHPRVVTRHNHLTRDILPYGQCPACDAHHDFQEKEAIALAKAQSKSTT